MHVIERGREREKLQLFKMLKLMNNQRLKKKLVKEYFKVMFSNYLLQFTYLILESSSC